MSAVVAAAGGPAAAGDLFLTCDGCRSFFVSAEGFCGTFPWVLGTLDYGPAYYLY